MDTTVEQRLKQYFATQRDFAVVSAYLFGSHAEKRAHRESDVDVGVLLPYHRYPTRDDRFDVRVRLGSRLIGALHENEVDLVILNDVPPPLGRRIVTEGLRVYCSDTSDDLAFQTQVQLRAADLQPFLERMRAIKLEALRR
jgi:predicted nucleotidyltransferase